MRPKINFQAESLIVRGGIVAKPGNATTIFPKDEFSSPVDQVRAGTEVLDVHLEAGFFREGKPTETVFKFDKRPPPECVIVRSHPVAPWTERIGTPAYLATVRRRSAKKLSILVSELAKKADDDGFVIWTHEVLTILRQTIQTLSEPESHSDFDAEGNACEILRLLRDCFLNDGWKRFAECPVRQCASAILDKLASADEITASDVAQATNGLLDLGLNPAVGFTW